MLLQRDDTVWLRNMLTAITPVVYESGMAELQEMSDEKLVGLVAVGHRPAFGELVRRHAARFYAVAARSLANRADAEDVVQEAFLKLWEQPTLWKADRQAKFTTWFYRVVVNGCTDRNRKKTPDLLEPEYEVEDAAETAEAALIREEGDSLLGREIAALPERQKLALDLCFYEGLSHKDAAEAMGVNLAALRSLLMRAKETLRGKLQPNAQKEDAA